MNKILLGLLVFVFAFSMIGSVSAVDIIQCQNITASGIYVLVNDIANATADPCFRVTADHVTINFNSSTVSGRNAFTGILSDAGNDNLTILGGTINGFVDSIILSGATNIDISNMTLTNSSDGGIVIQAGSIPFNITDNVIYNIFSIGIEVRDAQRDGFVARNNLSGNGEGIRINGDNSSLYENNDMRDNDIGIFVLITNDTITLLNNNISDSASGSITYNGEVTGNNNFLIYNNTRGEIRWFANNLSVTGDLIFESVASIFIGVNSAIVNSAVLNGITDSLVANVTLNSIPSVTAPAIFRNGVLCDLSTSPACFNFSVLTTAPIVFNVSSFSNYSILDSFIPNVCSDSNTVNIIRLIGLFIALGLIIFVIGAMVLSKGGISQMTSKQVIIGMIMILVVLAIGSVVIQETFNVIGAC